MTDPISATSFSERFKLDMMSSSNASEYERISRRVAVAESLGVLHLSNVEIISIHGADWVEKHSDLQDVVEL